MEYLYCKNAVMSVQITPCALIGLVIDDSLFCSPGAWELHFGTLLGQSRRAQMAVKHLATSPGIKVKSLNCFLSTADISYN